MTTQAIADETAAVDPAAPAAQEAPQAAPAPTLRQRLQTAIGSLTSAATALETAKTGQIDTDAEMEAARAAALSANTAVADGRTEFVNAANGLIEVVTNLRDSA